MTNNYEFFALRHLKLNIMAFALVFLSVCISMAYLFLPLFYFSTRLNNNEAMFLFISMFVLLCLLIWGSNKICKIYAGETWQIQFDDNSIKMVSNKYAEQLILFSHLYSITLFKDKALLGESMSIRFEFERDHSDSQLESLRFGIGKGFFSSQKVKDNHLIFEKFIVDLNDNILQSQYKITSNRDQYTIIIGHSSIRRPAKVIYIRR